MRWVTYNGLTMLEGEDASTNNDFYMVKGLPVFEGAVRCFDIVQMFDLQAAVHKKWRIGPSEKYKKLVDRQRVLDGESLPKWGDEGFERSLGRLSMESGDVVLVEMK